VTNFSSKTNKQTLNDHDRRLTNMGLKSRDGIDMREHWKAGIRSYLGTTTSGFPNMFMCYTPLAPTALSNGTTIIEVQCDFASAAIEKMLASDERQGDGRKIKSVEARAEAEDEWEAYVAAQNAQTLFPLTESWWTGANVPGKKPQMLTYLKGLAAYEQEIRAKLDGWDGFDVRYWDSSESTLPGVEAATSEDKAEHVSHVEHAEQDLDEASEAREILFPTTVA
jgi:hypothetical protein